MECLVVHFCLSFASLLVAEKSDEYKRKTSSVDEKSVKDLLKSNIHINFFYLRRDVSLSVLTHVIGSHGGLLMFIFISK
jgi:hypothetical protein